MLVERLKRKSASLINSVEAMSKEYNSLCKVSDADVTQTKGLVVSDEQATSPSLQGFLRHIVSKKLLKEVETSQKWDKEKDGHARDLIESFFSNLNEIWKNTPTGAWAVVGLQRRREKIQDALASLLTVYGVNTETHKIQQAIKGAACLLDYVGMTGGMPTADGVEESDYNERIKGGTAGAINFNKVGFGVCPKKEVAVQALLTDGEVRYPISELTEKDEVASFCRGAEAVEEIIAATEELLPLQQFSHLTDRIERAKVQYANIKALLACMPAVIEVNRDAASAVDHMLGMIVEDMLIELTPTVSIQGKPQSTRAVCAMHKKAYLLKGEEEDEAIAQILEKIVEGDEKQGAEASAIISVEEGASLRNAMWWQTCKQKIFTPSLLIGRLLQKPESVGFNKKLLGSIRSISPVGGEVPAECWFTMAGMIAIVKSISARVKQSAIWGDGDHTSIQNQLEMALRHLCVDAYLSPKYVAKSGLTHQDVFTSLVNSESTIKVCQDLFDGQNGFQSAYSAFSNSLTLHKETDERMRDNIISIAFVDAPEKDDAVLHAVGDIIKTSNEWSSAVAAQVLAKKATPSVEELTVGIAENIAVGSSEMGGFRRGSSRYVPVSSVESQAAPRLTSRGKADGRQGVTAKLPTVEKIFVENQAGSAMPVIKVECTSKDRLPGKMKALETVLQQAYNKKVWSRWGEANLMSIPNLAAATSCLVCLAMAVLSSISGDMIGLILNVATAVAVSWYMKNVYQKAVRELQNIPASYLSKLSEQGTISGEVDHKNWAWNKPEQQRSKGGFSVRSVLGYAAMLTPCLLIVALLLKAKGWLSLGSLGLRALPFLGRIAPVQATQLTAQIGQACQVLGCRQLVEKVSSSLTPR